MHIPQEIIASAKEKKLIFFIGAGVSKKCELPTWKELIIETLRENNDYIEHAEYILEGINNGIFELQESLEKLYKHKKYIYKTMENKLCKDVDNNIYKIMSNISKKFITTNFDKLIEYNTGIKNIIYRNSDYSLSKLNDIDSFVLKMHGDIATPDLCVVFKDDYTKLYRENGLSCFQFEKLLSENVCIYIGFSFNDVFVREIITKLLSLYGGYTRGHYILSVDKFEIENIKHIQLSRHDDIEIFLEKLNSSIVGQNKELHEDTIIESVESEENEENIYSLPETKINIADNPPEIKHWAGRNKELKILESKSFKSFFITGIGGQGKSALASFFYSSYKGIKDWRDFKEEGYNFNDKIVGMIENISRGSIQRYDIIGLETKKLIDIFFENIVDGSFLFVLDNIDKYIDLNEFIPSGDMQYFLDCVLRRPHNSTFIFTCRPFIQKAVVDFLQITLEGLSFEDVYELINLYSINIPECNKEIIVKRIFNATSGHPLWISLLFAQAVRGESVLNSFLDQIEKNSLFLNNETSFMSSDILKEVWNTLNRDQKNVLKALSQSVSPLTVDQIATVFGSMLNYKRANKSVATLKNLNLIEVKQTDSFELHPLVMAFVKSICPTSEQQTFSAILISHFGKYVLMVRENKTKNLNTEELGYIRDKIELSINSEKFDEATADIVATYDFFYFLGMKEELLRVSLKLMDIIIARQFFYKMRIFPVFFRNLIKLLSESGHRDCAEKYIMNILEIHKQKDHLYISILSSKIYCLWIFKDYSKAIKLCEEALYLLEKTSTSVDHDISHDHNLCLRDSMEHENVNKALRNFLGEYDLKLICDKKLFSSGVNGNFYGNIGRCLEFINKNIDALNCYAKSYILLDKDHRSLTSAINLGYASHWIASILFKMNDINTYNYFQHHALTIWKDIAPQLANTVLYDFQKINTTIVNSIRSLERWQIEKFCLDWVKEHIKTEELDFRSYVTS